MAQTITNEVLVLNTLNPITVTAAAADTADLAEVFTFTPTAFPNKYMIEIDNVSDANGTVTFSIAAGTSWAAGDALTGSVAQGVKSAIVLESGKYFGATGFVVTITPASGKKLLTDHTLTVTGVQLP